MRRKLVDSSQITSVGYDSATKVLEIEFVSNGSIYQYFGVPAKLHEQLMNTHSKGRFFTDNIKNGDFKYQKVK